MAGHRTCGPVYCPKILAPGEFCIPQLQVLACLQRALIGGSTALRTDIACGATEE